VSRFSLDDFPLWRKVLIITGILAASTIGFMVTSRELDVYGGAPEVPNYRTSEVFPVYVMHWSVRYLIQREYESLTLWRPLVGVPVLIVLGALVTSVEFWRAVRDQ
jgi:hypothetical protein